MKKTSLFLIFSFLFGNIAVSAEAQQVIKVETPVVATVTEQTPDEKMKDFFHSEEARVCTELRTFAKEQIFSDQKFMEAARDRSTRRVVKAASKYANALAKDYDADFVFYHPNTRFFVRINDKNYRGRMRLPADLIDSSSACFWERLPSQDLVYSVLMKIDGEKTGYLKISKKLTRMVGNIPDALSQYGKVRIYTALDKTGLKKISWFKMRRSEPNRTKYSGWCTAENLAFLTSIGTGENLAKKQQKKLLSMSDQTGHFVLPELNLSGGALSLSGLNGQRLGAVVYTLDTSKKNKSADAPSEEKEDPVEEENTENILYRFFD